jgi:predicted SAM-dependent methyltransferase
MIKYQTELGTAAQDITNDEDFTREHVKDFLRLDLACGQRKKEGFLGVDREKIEGVDIVHDLTQYPWPFEDNSVYEIHCSHYVEHVVDLVSFMNECYRILKPLGVMTIYCPYYSSERAWQDPTHVRAITMNTFRYFDRQWAKDIVMDHYMGECDFEVVSVVPLINNEWKGRADEAIQWAMKHYINVVDDLQVVLRKRG